MTTANLALHEWASHPVGKLTRLLIAIGGMAAATVLLMLSPMASNGSWAVVLTGLALTATSVRAAVYPTNQRLGVLVLVVLAVPFVTQLI